MPHATATIATPDTRTAHDCLLDCGDTTTHESGVCDSCADHDETDVVEIMATLSPYDEAYDEAA